MTRFILDSGDPQEYQEALQLFKDHGKELWGSTTNPSLIAKKIATQGKKLTTQEAFALQKSIVSDILSIVPGAVSAEVYADTTTTAAEMIEQGEEIAAWDKRVVIKLPTTLEGFKARTALRQKNIVTNNTLVFSQQQIFAIALHEHLMQTTYQVTGTWPSFISPFLGRLDDIGEDGLTLVRNGMELKKTFPEELWILAASVRHVHHLEASIALGSELITAPLSVYKDYFEKTSSPSTSLPLQQPPLWEVPHVVQSISTIDLFMEALVTGRLTINHPLTDKGLEKFTQDWQAILQ